MPIYDAKCKKCEHIHEYTSSIANRDSAPKCPECGAKSERTLVKPSGFRLKGCGWYETMEKSVINQKNTDRPG